MATNVLTDTLNMREDDVDYEIEITLTDGQLVKYAKDEDCGTPAHVTAKNNKRFEHLHVNYTLPQSGTVVRRRTGDDWEDVDNGATKTVTATKVDAYWDHEYAGYTKVADTASITCNCIGYARGFNTWIEPLPNTNSRGVIEENDYEDTSVYAAGNLERGSTHDIVIVEVWAVHDGKIKKTRETNGQGSVYEKTYASPGREVKMGYKMVKRKA